jgi:hypothetical protein
MENPKLEMPDLEILFATALYLAANYAKTGCPLLCRMVQRQLSFIETHPDPSVSPALRKNCRNLRREWEGIRAARAQALQSAPMASGAVIHPLH